jgi:hypothetical protein
LTALAVIARPAGPKQSSRARSAPNKNAALAANAAIFILRASRGWIASSLRFSQ